MVQTQKHAPLALVLLDWSEAGRLSAPLRYSFIVRGSFCGNDPDIICAYAKNLLTRLGNPCDVFF